MILKKIDHQLYSTTEDDSSIKIGQFVSVKKAEKGRSLPDHKMFWAVATNVAMQKIDGLGEHNKALIVEDMIKRTMLANGLCDTYSTGGKQYSTAWSLKFSKTKQERFKKIRHTCYNVWASWCGVSVEELTDSIGDIN